MKARLETLRKGVTTTLPASKSLDVAGETLTPQEVESRLTALISPFEAAEVAQVRASQAIHDRDEVRPSALQFAEDLEAALRGSLGPTNAALEHFGIAPKRPRARRSSAAKAEPAPAKPAKPTERAA